MSYLANFYSAEPPEELMYALAGGTSGSKYDKASAAAAAVAKESGKKKLEEQKRLEQQQQQQRSTRDLRFVEFDLKVVREKYEAEPIAKMDEAEFLRRWSLHRAARCGNIEALDRLLHMFRSYPRWVATPDEDGCSALHRAAEAKDDAAGAAAIVRLSAADGIDPEATSPDIHQWRPLHRAVIANNPKCIKALLVNCHAAPDSVDASKRTALHWCAFGNRFECANEIIDRNAALSPQDMLKRTPLHLAAERSSLDIIDLLCKCRAEREARDVNFMTPLLYAATLGKAESVAVLFEMGANVEAQCYNFGTALLHAVERAADSKGKPEEQAHLKTVKTLIYTCNADIEATTKDTGLRAVHLAARRGAPALLRMIIDANCYADARTKDLGRSALHLVCMAAYGAKKDKAQQQAYEQCARILIGSGRVDPFALDESKPVKLSAAAIAEKGRNYEILNSLPKKEDEDALNAAVLAATEELE